MVGCGFAKEATPTRGLGLCLSRCSRFGQVSFLGLRTDNKKASKALIDVHVGVDRSIVPRESTLVNLMYVEGKGLLTELRYVHIRTGRVLSLSMRCGC